MVKIVYSVFNRGVAMEPREIAVTTHTPYHSRCDHPRLKDFVKQYGPVVGAQMYCKECFTHSAIALLEIHDGTGCVEKII